MVDVPLPLLAVAFLLGGAFLYLGINYLNLSQSQSLYQQGLKRVSEAGDACGQAQYDACLQSLLQAQSKLVEARSKINSYDSATAGIYAQVGNTIEEVDLLLAFVSFSKKVDSMLSAKDYNLAGSKGDPCELARQAGVFVQSSSQIEPDAQALATLVETAMVTDASRALVLETLDVFYANTLRVAALQPALEATCTVKTQIEPKIDPDDDSITLANLRNDPQLPTVKAKLLDSLRLCQAFVKDEDASLINFTLGECSWIQSNLASVDALMQFLSSESAQQTEGFTASKLFVTLKNYSDIVTMVDPLDEAVRSQAIRIARDYPGEPSRAQAEAIFRYVRDEIVYLSPPLTIHQRVQRPEASLELKAGNCADKAVLAASLYMAVGYPVKAVLQDRFHTPEEIAAGAAFAPDHMFVKVKIGDAWHTAEVTCTNCPFDSYTSADTSTLLEMDIPMPE